MATSQAPLLKFRGIDTTTGLPLVGGKLFTYAAGTVNKLTTYTDSTGNTPNANPIILDARGECDLFFTQTLLYKLTLSPATDTDPPTAPIWTEDQVVPIGSAADIITNTANLAASTGATLVGWISKATGAIATTISKWIDRQTPSVFDFMTDAQIADVQAGTLLVDVTAACQAALTASKSAIFNDGGYRLTDNLLLKTGQCVQLSSGVTLRQYTADKNIFRAVQKDDVWLLCNGATLYGLGNWSSLWTGMSGHEDRAIQFLGCTNSGIIKPRIKNCATAGIAILGGSNNLIDCPRVEGTHTYGVPLVSGNNNQVGVYLTNHATYGNVENTRIIKPDISGVAQGILEEAQAGIAHRTGMLTIDSPVLHDIPGQHGMYMQMGNLTVTSPSGANLTLSLVKLSSGNANLDTKGYSVTGANAYNIGGSIFELDVVGTGSINDALLTGTGRSVGYGIGITGKVSSIKADIVSDTAVGSHVYMTGANQSDVDITVNGRNSGQDGVLINATAATGIKIRPTLRESNTTTTASGCGIRLASASANVELFDPDVTDASTKMVYGLFNSIAGSTVKVRGSAKFTGASDTAVRATGVITEWPTEATLSGTNGAFTSQGNVSSSQEMVTTARSTSVTSVVVWQRTLPDASVTQVTVRLSGKLLNSAERRTLTLVSTFWRSGGVATQQGATTVISDHASAGFLGAYSLGVDGANGVALLANSGGVSTYDWVARSTVNVMS